MRTRLRIALIAVVAMAATGCPADDTTTPPDGTGGGALSVTWESQPGVIPSEPSSDATIERVVFLQNGLRVVGDAGTFDLDRDELEWSRGIVPTALPVADAAPGLYSRLLFDLDGDEGDGDYAYEITGTVKVSTAFQPFTIRDTEDLALSLDFSIMLPVGGSATIPVRIAIDKIVEAVDFAQVPMEDGRYLVESDSPQISAVRAAVSAAFSVPGPV